MRPLMPIGIGAVHCAYRVKFGDLIRAQIPADGPKIISELPFVTCSDDEG